MFFFRKKKDEEKYPFEIARVSLPEGTSYLGKNLDIVGTVSGDGSIVIMGSVNGIFDMTGELNVGGTAKISGELRSDTISVNGFIEGTLIASRKIYLNATANIKGIIVTPMLSLIEGALFDGEVRMSNGSETGIEFTDDWKNEKAGLIKTKRFLEEAGAAYLLSKSASLISRDSRIEGDITGKESIIIEGSVKGSIKIDGSIFVGASGIIEADVEADNISVQGNITGNVAARGQLDIQPSGRISGDISARSIDIKEGASFEGRSRMINYVSEAD
ncbi:MAG: polymer-forming cytoskeletal protein [Desulfobacteraceae bacterium]|nr:MAG: polymer-forming cytoskeletal protein [Desulfobacteraceae bacterium]